MTYNKTTKLVMASLMAAMTCIATMIVKFPVGNGYIHLGDGLVLLCGIILGPLYGGAAAGIGSMLADILSGYAYYAIGTFMIKALAAIVGAFVYSRLSKSKISSKIKLFPIILAGTFGGIIVTVGYFLFSALYLGEGLAAASAIPANIVQNIFGIIISSLLMPALIKVPYIRIMISQKA